MKTVKVVYTKKIYPDVLDYKGLKEYAFLTNESLALGDVVQLEGDKRIVVVGVSEEVFTHWHPELGYTNRELPEAIPLKELVLKNSWPKEVGIRLGNISKSQSYDDPPKD